MWAGHEKNSCKKPMQNYHKKFTQKVNVKNS